MYLLVPGTNNVKLSLPACPCSHDAALHDLPVCTICLTDRP